MIHIKCNKYNVNKKEYVKFFNSAYVSLLRILNWNSYVACFLSICIFVCKHMHQHTGTVYYKCVESLCHALTSTICVLHNTLTSK